jgi:23S rRNA (adenine2503-C2)-methyltransferase
VNPLNPSTNIYDLTLEELKEVITSWGQPAYRAGQLWHGLYRQFWDSPELFTTLPKSTQTQLKQDYSFHNLEPIKTLQSTDGQTIKNLFRLPDGQAIEAVLMAYDKRNSLCISTQAGCAMGCVFCATGQMGFRRNLSQGEIIEQVLHYARLLNQKDEKVTNIVVMGMGEPFHNYKATMAAIDQLNHPDGFNFGARRFTISTVGLVPEILRFAQEQRQVNLAISLHAADDDLRSSILPINKKYPLRQLMDACHQYVVQTNRRITFEWALIDGVNDSNEQAEKLAILLKGMLCHVNLIPLNPTHGYGKNGSTKDRVKAFQEVLDRHHIPCTVRIRRGIDIQAGCGQLAIQA